MLGLVLHTEEYISIYFDFVFEHFGVKQKVKLLSVRGTLYW